MTTEYVDLVGWTLSDAEQLLRPLGLTAESRPAPYCQATTERREAKYRLQAGGWIDRHAAINAKWCRLQSPKVDVAICMIYPTTRPECLPVFGAEWVVVGDSCQLAVLDVHPAGDQPQLREELRAVFPLIGGRHQALLPPADAPPEWFRTIAQPWALFTRCPVDRVGLLRAAFREYLAAAVEYWYAPRHAACGGGTDSASVAAYKRFQYDHSPGRQILSVTFGAEYAEGFLAWHCGPPNQCLVRPAASGSESS